jgi:hypothetical protein
MIPSLIFLLLRLQVIRAMMAGNSVVFAGE